MSKISDASLYDLLSCLGLQQVNIAIEVLRGHIGLEQLRHRNPPIEQNPYSLSDEEITDAAANAALDELRYHIRSEQRLIHELMISDFDDDPEDD
jgi:hypothetical protein